MDASRSSPRTTRPTTGETARLLALLAEAPFSLCYLRGSDHVIEYANRGFFELVGPRDCIGLPVREAFPELEGQGYFELLDHVQDTGEEVARRQAPAMIDRDLLGRPEPAHFDFVYRPIPGDDGEADGILIVATEVTAQVQAQRNLRLRVDIGAALTANVSLRDKLQACTEALVDHLDVAFARIWTLDEREQVLALQASAGIYTHLDGPHGRVPVGKYKIGLIAQERRPHLTNEVVGDPRVSDQDWARREGMRAFAGYPLVIQDRLVGVMAMFAREPLNETVLDSLASVADEIAIGIDQSRMFAERDHVANTLQRSLLPVEVPSLPGLEIATLYRPADLGADVGGDFFDVFENEDGSWSIVVGDVCGKGVDAAALTALARYTVRALANREDAPSRVLDALNAEIVRQRGDGRFCTVCYTRWTPDSGAYSGTLCCAGHPLPYLVRTDGEVEQVGHPGTLLGFFEDPELTDATGRLAPGETFVVYTDGLVERRGWEPTEAERRVVEVLRKAAGAGPRELVRLIEEELAAGPVTDDVAVVAISPS